MSDQVLYSRPVFSLRELQNVSRGAWKRIDSFDLEQEIINQFKMSDFYCMKDSTDNGTYICKYNVISFTIEESIKKS